MIRRLARGAVAFLDWLDADDLTLGSCGQADLDRWLADEHASHREEAGRSSAGPAPASSPPATSPPPNGPGPPSRLDHEHRWDTARRLLHDDTLKPEDRLAGLLVLLYAQGVTAISRMTASQIQASDDGVRLRLGRVPVHLPEPAATIARAVRPTARARRPSAPGSPRPGCSPEASPAGRSAPTG